MALDGGTVEIRFEGDIAPLRKSVDEATGLVEGMGSTVSETDKELSRTAFDGFGKKTREEFNSFKQEATESFSVAINKASEFSSLISNLGRSAKGVGLTGLTIGLTSATKALTSLIRKGVQATDFLETSRVAMSGLTGSIEEGNKAMSLAANFWQNNPFQRIDVTQATKQLVQFGRTTNDISSDLAILGDVSLSTGMNIADLARSYARVSASGRAMTMDLEMMSDRGVPIYRELEKQLNATTDAVRKMASEGKIDFETFRKAMEGAVSAEAMAQYEDTLARQVDRFKGSIQILAGELAGYKIINNELVISSRGLEKTYTKLLNTLASVMRNSELREGLQKFGEAIANLMNTIFQFYEVWETQSDGTKKLVQHSKTLEVVFGALAKLVKFLGDNSELLLPLLGGLAIAISNVASQLPFIGPIVNQIKAPFMGLYDTLKKMVKLSPSLSAFIGLLAVGFVDAYKNDEEFKQTIQDILAILKEIFANIMDAAKSVLPVIKDTISMLVRSGAIRGILQGVATAVKILAEAIASMSPETLAGLMSFFLSLKLLKTSPIMLLATAFSLLFGYIKKFLDEGKSLPETLLLIGKNMMVGLFNGIVDGAKAIWNFLRSFVEGVVKMFKTMLGIHSPSTVMYAIGENVALGLAEGIEDSSDAVQIAMENLATDILKACEKIVSNKVSFGLLDIKSEYQEWKKISKLFTVGSEQYNAAIEKMEDARKQANLRIVALQNEYNNRLDDTIEKISQMYGLFDSVSKTNTTNSNRILTNLSEQLAMMQEWGQAQDIINDLNLAEDLKDELRQMGVSSVAELSAIANMTSDELAELNDMWLQKQSIANEQGVKQMAKLKNETLDEINDLKSGIDGVTVDVADVGGRLVADIAEGVYGAMPTLESAFSQLGSYIEDAQKKLAKSASSLGESLDVGGDENNTQDSNDLAKTLTEEVEKKLNQVKDVLPALLWGVIGAWAASKIIPKLFPKLGQMLFKTGAKSIGAVAGPAKTIAENATSISQSMQTTSKGFSKVDQVFESIKKGAQSVIWIAGAIAAVAVALWAAYNLLKDMDFLKFQVVLLEMTEAVAVFGTLAFLAESFGVSVKSILSIAGLAADIAVVALACRVAYEAMNPINFWTFQLVLLEMAEALVAMGALATAAGVVLEATMGAMALGMLAVIGLAGDIAVAAVAIRGAYEAMAPIDFGKFQLVILEMIEALGVMGGFSTLFGILVPLVGLGWVSITAICDELCKTSEALYKVYTTVPDDFDGVNDKIDLIKKVLNKIVDTDLGTLIGSIVASWEVGPLTRIIDMYVHVAEQLNKLSTIKLDKDAIENNLNYIKTTLETVKAKSDVITGWLEASALDMEASSVENAGRIVKVYGDMVDALNKLSDFKPNEEAIGKNLLTMVAVITLLRNSSYGNGGLFTIFNNMDTIANDVEKIKSIVKNYLEMVPTMQDLGKKENQISDSVKTTVTKNIENIKSIVLTIGSVDTGGWIDQKESDIKKIQSILNTFTEIIPTVVQLVNQMLKSGVYKNKETVISTIKAVDSIIYQIGECGTGGYIEAKEKDLHAIQSIINQFTQIIPVVGQVIRQSSEYKIMDDKDTIIRTISTVEEIVRKIGDVSVGNNAETKAWNLQYIQSMINKFTEFVPTLYQLKDTGIKDNEADVKKTIDSVVSIINKINSFSTALNSSLADKEWAIGMAVSMVKKMLEFQKAVGQLSDSLPADGINATIGAITGMFGSISTKFNENLATFENIGASLGQSLANGISSKSGDVYNAGVELQSSLWNSLNDRMNDEYWEGVEMANKFAEGLKSVSFDNVGASMQSSLWWGIQNRMNDEYYQGRSMGERFRQGLYDIDYGNAGWWAIQGFINGAWGRAGAYDGMYNTGRWVAERFLQGIKDRGQQGSPWKTTIESGNWAIEGLIDGMKEQETALVGEANSLAEQVVDALSMDDLTLQPTLDATVNGNLAPSLAEGNYGIIGTSGQGVAVQQINNNYTTYDVEQVQRDLAYALSKV